ncbi:MAG: twitching motility protein PilU [Pseudoalteromonas tetraodonis]|jgi:twitching motility protein PilU
MLKTLLRLIVEKDGSDLYLSSGVQPSMKVNGKLYKIGKKMLDGADVEKIALEVMNAEQAKAFEQKPEMNLAIDEPDIGRFRINIFRQRNDMAMVIRVIKTELPNYKVLGLPEMLTELVMAKRGLMIFVGGTGSGKSTSLAALIDYRNQTHAGHIITIEDPIEFIHPHKRSIVNQREVGVDTHSYQDALENTLRQAPDVILIGEIRNRETMEHALAFAETGHLCLSTLHANNADQALDRIINFFPEERHKQLFTDISLNIQGIISQRLIPTVDGGRTAAVEILTGSPRMKDLIKAGRVTEIKEAMNSSEAYGMQTFDLALLRLFQAGQISEDEALKNADSPNNLRLQLNDTKGFKSETTFELEVEPDPEDEEDERVSEESFGQVFSAT